jgi:hypothetical protein
MNIFFVGPYRQDNFDGILSRNIILSLAEKHNVFIRPIYYTGQDLVGQLDRDIELYEDDYREEYDCLVQHVKPSDTLLTTRFGKNITIPIVDTSFDDKYYITHTVDKILIDADDANLSTLINSSKVKPFDYTIHTQINKDKVFDVGPLNHFTKLYTISDYKDSQDTILSLIRSFIYLRTQLPQEYCLILFIINITQNDISFLQNYIQQTYKSLGASHTINKINIIPIPMSYEHTIAAHNSGNIFLNVTSNSINKKIATHLNKPTIEPKTILTKSLLSNNTINKKPSYIINDQNIIDTIIDYFHNNINNTTKSKTKKQHISDLI